MASVAFLDLMKKLCLKTINYLNIGFLGYEVSEISQKPRQIGQVEQRVVKTEEKTNNDATNHAIIVIAFCILICILAVIIYAIRIMKSVQKQKSQKKTVTSSQSLTV